MSKIEQTIADRLLEMNITFAVSYVGQTKRDNDWDCDQWKVTFSRPERVLESGRNMPAVSITEDYFTGLGHRKQVKPMPQPPYRKGTLAYEAWAKDDAFTPQAPTADSVLHSLVSDASAVEMSFSDWCSDYGYDSDSIKALNTYKACEHIGHGMRALLGRDGLETFRKLLQDY